MNEIFFNAEKLSVGYDRKTLISDISFSLKRGEILTLIGPNGAGKSTILKTITRQLKALDGIVTIDGDNMMSMSVRTMARKMSVVLTDRIAPELMTCRKVVQMGRYPYTGYFGMLTKEDERIAEDAINMVGAADFADMSFSGISDGQRQRIMLARAICQQPDIIVLDEPTSYLDIKHKISLLNILRRMSRENKITVIMSLHEIDLAGRISDKIMCVNGSRIDKAGTPEEIFTDDIIAELYDIREGSYDTLIGSVELEKPAGKPDILVIGGNGSGIPVYRRLQRDNIPFCAGVLFENDTDWRVASALAAEVVSQRAFTPVDSQTEAKAMKILENVSVVIDCGCAHGEYDRINVELLKKARRMGKNVITREEWYEQQ